MFRKHASAEAESDFHESGYLLSATDTMLIGFELMTLFLFLMYAHLTIGHTQSAVSVVMFGGVLSVQFWLWVVTVGLLIPAAIELKYIVPKLIYKSEYHSHRNIDIIVPVTVLIGGFMLRYVVLIAGQITHPIGL
jgi:formate-dependent nitrite reductase membrane component NrfD